jgi:hypothetical protein
MNAGINWRYLDTRLSESLLHKYLPIIVVVLAALGKRITTIRGSAGFLS